jgi:hypothetical protein
MGENSTPSNAFEPAVQEDSPDEIGGKGLVAALLRCANLRQNLA